MSLERVLVFAQPQILWIKHSTCHIADAQGKNLSFIKVLSI